MTTKIETAQAPTATDEKAGLLAKLAARIRSMFSAIDAHCASVEQAKEACDRENLKKNGKDWVNRCCGG